MSQTRRWQLTAAALIVAYPVQEGVAKEIGPNDDFEAEINKLGADEELVLRGGSYSFDSRFLVTVSGNPGAPIVIRAKDGERPHVVQTNLSQNIIEIQGSHLVFRGIEFSGGSRGVRLMNASFVTIDGCTIHGTAGVTLAANDGGASYQGLQLLNNEIYDTDGTGEGMYLGCNNNGCQVFDSLIAGNYIHHTNASTVSQGDGIELKEGSYNNVIRDNVIHDAKYPCIISYSTAGNGPPNTIERNVLWACGDHGIQSAADAVIRNNIILDAAGNGISLQPHQNGTPSNLQVLHNTVLNSGGNAIRASGITGSVIIANNAAYAQTGSAIMVGGTLTELVVVGNVGSGGLSGTGSGLDNSGQIGGDFVDGHFGGAPPIDLFPAVGSPLIGGGDPAHTVADDFNGTVRGGQADVGAYAYDVQGNPGWVLAPSFKGATAPPPVDAGVPADSAPPGDSSPPADAAPPPVDSNQAPVDAAQSPADSARQPADAARTADAARPFDAALPGDARRHDASATDGHLVDSGFLDAGEGPAGNELAGGCGCSSAQQPDRSSGQVGAIVLLLFASLGFVRRWRRKPGFAGR